MNLVDHLFEHAVPARVALVTEREEHSYGELVRAIDGMTRTLRELGIQPGDRVGLFADNSLFWVAAYLGTLKLGAVAVPCYPTLQPEQFRALMDATGVRALCAAEKYLTRYGTALPDGVVRIVEDAAARARQEGRGGPVVATGPGDPLPSTPVDPATHLAALMFTSGSTGTPRGVMVTHGNIIANTDGIVASLELDAHERIMAVLPFYYCFGTSLLHTHLRAGGSLVLNNRFAFPRLVLDQLESTGCTGLAGVPSTYQILLRNANLRERTLPCLRKLQQAGGRLADVFIRELREALPHARYYLMYGQTEATARLSFLPPELADSKLGSIGRGMPGVELRILDEAGQPVPPGTVGEIVARGANITRGYWQDPELTRQYFRDGALWTGDLARADEEGFIYIVDRAKDFIKPSGHRTGCKEIEGHIVAVPDVVEAAVIGVPDEVLGEVARAFVVLRPGAQATVEDILAHCKRSMPGYMVPGEVVVLRSLPKNAAGKVLKTELKNPEAVNALRLRSPRDTAL